MLTRVLIPVFVFLLIAVGAGFVAAESAATDTVSSEDPIDVSYEETAQKLLAQDFSEKSAAIDKLAQFGDKRTPTIFNNLLEGNLYYQKKDNIIVTAEELEDGELKITDVLTGNVIGTVGSRAVQKISVNNNLRNQLRTTVAGLELSDQDKSVRLTAAKNLIKNGSEDLLPSIKRAVASEQDAEVLKSLKLAMAIIDIKSTDATVRLLAVKEMEGVLESEIIATLTQLSTPDAEGIYPEKDPQVLAEAKRVVSDSKSAVSYYKILENLFFGVSLGSVLLLSAVGLAITFGVMGIINMAHGEMMMLGAYTTYVIQQLMPNYLGLSIIVAVPAAFVVAGIVGIIIERGVIRFLYGRPLETLLATFGISLILQQLVRSIFSPLNRSVATPDWMAGSLQINGALSLTYNRLYIIVFSLVVLAALILLLRNTIFGLQMRAVTQNRSMANSMGIRSSWVDALTFGLGSGIAGIAGVALSQLTNVGPNLGQSYIIDSFMVVVFGGVGNLFGTFFAAMSLGIINKFAEPYAGAVLAKILILIFIILFIQRRPRGLFALKGRAVEG